MREHLSGFLAPRPGSIARNAAAATAKFCHLRVIAAGFDTANGDWGEVGKGCEMPKEARVDLLETGYTAFLFMVG